MKLLVRRFGRGRHRHCPILRQHNTNASASRLADPRYGKTVLTAPHRSGENRGIGFLSSNRIPVYEQNPKGLYSVAIQSLFRTLKAMGTKGMGSSPDVLNRCRATRFTKVTLDYADINLTRVGLMKSRSIREFRTCAQQQNVELRHNSVLHRICVILGERSLQTDYCPPRSNRLMKYELRKYRAPHFHLVYVVCQ